MLIVWLCAVFRSIQPTVGVGWICYHHFPHLLASLGISVMTVEIEFPLHKCPWWQFVHCSLCRVMWPFAANIVKQCITYLLLLFCPWEQCKIRISQKPRPYFIKFSVHVICCHVSVLLWLQCNTLCTSVLWLTTCLPIVGHTRSTVLDMSTLIYTVSQKVSLLCLAITQTYMSRF